MITAVAVTLWMFMTTQIYAAGVPNAASGGLRQLIPDGNGQGRVHNKAICYNVNGRWKIARHLEADNHPQTFLDMWKQGTFQGVVIPDGEGNQSGGKAAAIFAERSVDGRDENLVIFAGKYLDALDLYRYEISTNQWRPLSDYGIHHYDGWRFAYGDSRCWAAPRINGRFNGMVNQIDEKDYKGDWGPYEEFL